MKRKQSFRSLKKRAKLTKAERNRSIVKAYRAGASAGELAQRHRLTLGGLKALLARERKAGRLKAGLRPKGPVQVRRRRAKQSLRPTITRKAVVTKTRINVTPKTTPLIRRSEEEIPRVTTSFRIKPDVRDKLKRYVAKAYLAGRPLTLSQILEKAIETWLRRHPLRNVKTK